METFSDFKIKLLYHTERNGWYFELYSMDEKTHIATGDEVYETEGTARYAAIGHIHLMELSSKSEHS